MIEILETRIAPAPLIPTPQMAADALKDKLAEFAADKTAPGKTAPVITYASFLTAKADDLVYAVYQLTLTEAFNDGAEAAVLINTALCEQPSGSKFKARADKDKIAPRILSAALLGTGLTNDAAAVTQMTSAVVDVNTGKGTALTITGKEKVIGQGLKLTAASDASVGEALGELAFNLSGGVPGTGTPETKLRTFAIAAIKAAGAGTGNVDAFTGKLLTHVAANETSQGNFVSAVAIGVVGTPSAAGEVYDGFADALNNESKIKNVAVLAVTNQKLSKAIGPIVAGTASATAVGDEGDFANFLVSGFAGNKATTAVRGAVASGAIQAADATSSTVTVADIITKVLAPGNKRLAKSELATFAGAAAVGVGARGADIMYQIAGLAVPTGGDDLATLTNVGVSILKAIAPTKDASAARSIGTAIVLSSTVFGMNNDALTAVAKNLVKGVPTAIDVAGGAAAGIAAQLNTGTPDSAALSTFAGSVIPSASKAALSITREVAKLLPVPVAGGIDYAEFASNVAKTSGFNSTDAAGVAAGAVVAAILNGSSSTTGQTPGDIAVAVANASRFTQAKLLTIASTVAQTIEVERIAGLGGKVAAALEPKVGVDNKLPKITSVGTLASSLAKAINTKPLVGSVNRADELGELAAEMTRAVVTKFGPLTDTTTLGTYLSALGTGVLKALSAKQVHNGGAFAADLQDATRDIVGSIAQTISVLGLNANVISDATVTALLSDTGSLAKALTKQVKATYAAEITSTSIPVGAFAEVRAAKGTVDRLVAGSETQGFGEAFSNTSGRYEIGALPDSESRPFSVLP